MIAVHEGRKHYTLPPDPTPDDRLLDAACRLIDSAEDREEHPIVWESAIERARRALELREAFAPKAATVVLA